MEKEKLNELKQELSTASTEVKNEVAKTLGMELPRNITDKVMNSILKNAEQGKMNLPKNYSVGNALKTAFYILSTTVDKNNNNVLKSCSEGSVAISLLFMVTKGLDAAKDQVYFIPYGSILKAIPSYFGNMLMVSRLNGYETPPVATLIYKGDKVKLGLTELGEECILEHNTTWENKLKREYDGAYATIIFNGKLRSCVMTMAEIKESWSMSKFNKEHKDFTGEFMKRTVINRLLKPILKASDDEYLFETDIPVNEIEKNNVEISDDNFDNIEEVEKVEIINESDTEESVEPVTDGELKDTVEPTNTKVEQEKLDLEPESNTRRTRNVKKDF